MNGNGQPYSSQNGNRRLSTSLRGYGTHHQQLRQQLAPVVALGKTPCARCGQLIQPDEKWDLDHGPDRLTYLGPSHAARNRSTSHRVGEQIGVRITSREW